MCILNIKRTRNCNNLYPIIVCKHVNSRFLHKCRQCELSSVPFISAGSTFLWPASWWLFSQVFSPLRIAKSWSKHTSLKYTAGIYNFYNYQNGFLRITRMFVFVVSDMQGINSPWFLVNQRIITNCKNTTTLNLQVRVTSELFCNKNLFSQICLFYSNIWIKFCSISVSYLRAQSKIMHQCSTDSEMIKPYYWTEPKTKIQFSYF